MLKFIRGDEVALQEDVEVHQGDWVALQEDVQVHQEG